MKKWLAIGIVPVLVSFVILMQACGGNGSGEPHTAVSDLKVYKSVPEFSGLNFDGSPITGEVMKGKVWVAYFFFTSCSGPCPKMSSVASVLNDEYRSNPDFRIVSFTVDPRHDTPAVLQKYAVRYGATAAKWPFVRMSADSVSNLAVRGFMQSASPEDPSLHGTKFMLVDRQGNIRGFFNYEEQGVNALRSAIDALLEDGA